MNQAAIQSQLQVLKWRLAVALSSENNSSGDLLVICADILLLIDQVKDTAINRLLKQRALSCIQECQAELDGYHERYAATVTITAVPLIVAGKSLEQAMDLLLFSFT